jgi:hypothetical protein
MKIRLGFVSNSSTSSFCIYGYSINKNDESLLCKLQKETSRSFIVPLEIKRNRQKFVIGVGNLDTHVDQWYNGDCEYYEAEEPDEKLIEIFNKFAEKNNIDTRNCKIYRRTWSV